MLRNILVVRFIFHRRSLEDFKIGLSLIYNAPIRILFRKWLMIMVWCLLNWEILAFRLNEYDSVFPFWQFSFLVRQVYQYYQWHSISWVLLFDYYVVVNHWSFWFLHYLVEQLLFCIVNWVEVCNFTQSHDSLLSRMEIKG